MSVFSLNSSHIGSLPPPGQQQDWPRQSSDQRSKTSNNSTNTVQHNPGRKVSASSAGSLGSHSTGFLRVRNENISPNRSPSYAIPPTTADLSRHSPSENVSRHGSLKASWRNNLSAFRQTEDHSSLVVHEGTLEDVDLNANDDSSSTKSSQKNTKVSRQQWQHAVSLDTERSRMQPKHDSLHLPNQDGRSGGPSIAVIDTEANPFKKFLSTLRPQTSKHTRTLSARTERWTLDEFDDDTGADLDIPKPTHVKGHRKASSWPSSGLVTVLKSATTAQGPASDVKGSERASKLWFLRRSNRSSGTSDAANRTSVDSGQDMPRILEDAAKNRALHRRKVLEELLVSEEGYINDLKILAHVYFTILASTSQFPRSMQIEIERNLSEILSLHEEILIEIKSLISDPPSRHGKAPNKHQRWNSVDSVEGKPSQEARSARRSIESLWFRQFKSRSLTSKPQEAAEVAKVFGRLMSRFFVYEEYGARYESMLKLVASISKAIPSWWAYERGIEALVNSLMSKNSAEEKNKKGLTLEDLLIKPVQRVCRYPLLFAELLKTSPTLDDSGSEAVIRKVLDRFRETAHEINKATNDPQARARIQRSWQLQDLLSFSERSVQSLIFRTLGHVKLCGVLYIVYRSKEEVRGDYMLCALFNAHLLLATPEAGNKQFKVLAIVSTTDSQIATPDDGRGLQCHNVLYAWKLVFNFDLHLYELMMCACSAREEDQWRTELSRSPNIGNTAPAGLDCTFLGLDMQYLTFVFGRQGTLSRRIAMERAATADQLAKQVIIKNTHSVRDGQECSKVPSASFNRSHSLLSTNRIPVFAPDRADRVRLEQALESVWTKDMLPFPGMTTNRGGAFIRASKNSVMRKLSKASTASQSSKRSVSYANTIDPFVDDEGYGDQDIAQPIVEEAIQSTIEKPATVRSKLECYQGDRSCSDIEDQDGFASQTTTTKATRSRGNSDATIVAYENDVKDTERASKLRKPKTLLKAFSAEGIRTWFA